jgi:hypothetical protein
LFFLNANPLICYVFDKVPNLKRLASFRRSGFYLPLWLNHHSTTGKTVDAGKTDDSLERQLFLFFLSFS